VVHFTFQTGFYNDKLTIIDHRNIIHASSVFLKNPNHMLKRDKVLIDFIESGDPLYLTYNLVL